MHKICKTPDLQHYDLLQFSVMTRATVVLHSEQLRIVCFQQPQFISMIGQYNNKFKMSTGQP